MAAVFLPFTPSSKPAIMRAKRQRFLSASCSIVLSLPSAVRPVVVTTKCSSSRPGTRATIIGPCTAASIKVQQRLFKLLELCVRVFLGRRRSNLACNERYVQHTGRFF
jgi:hypothetical protein